MEGHFYPSATGVLYVVVHHTLSPAPRCRVATTGAVLSGPSHWPCSVVKLQRTVHHLQRDETGLPFAITSA
jgi:hypothetical protein